VRSPADFGLCQAGRVDVAQHEIHVLIRQAAHNLDAEAGADA